MFVCLDTLFIFHTFACFSLQTKTMESWAKLISSPSCAPSTSSRRILFFFILDFIYSFCPSDKHVTKCKWRNSCLMICANNKKNSFLSVWSGIYLKKKKGAALSLTFRCMGLLGATFYLIDLFFFWCWRARKSPKRPMLFHRIIWCWFKYKRKKNQKRIKSFQNKPQTLDWKERKSQCKQLICHLYSFRFPFSLYFSDPTRGV